MASIFKTALTDKIFPGLWKNTAQGNAIFADKGGKASLLLIEHYPTPQKVLKFGAKRLAAFFKKHNTKVGVDTANRIIQAARNPPAMSTQRLESDIQALQAHLAILKTLSTHIEHQKGQMAKFLIQPPGLYLVSLPGGSIVYAADFTAEVGNIQRFA